MSNKQEEFDITYTRMCLIRVKVFSELALKHLEEVKGEELPNDPSFRQTLWTLLDAVGKYGDEIDNKLSTRVGLPLPGVEDAIANVKE